jgi:hypothetical protein
MRMITSIARAPIAIGLALLACVLSAAIPARTRHDVPSVTQFLREVIKLEAAQLAAAERGEPVVQVLETHDVRDVAVFGIVAVNASREDYVRHLGDFQQSLRTPTRARLGIFSAPAVLGDVQPVSFEKQDVEDLRKCQPGKCDFKLPAAEMRRMRDRVNGAADPLAELTAYARQRLVEYVTDYRARGDSAMVVYDDRGNVRASDAFAALLAQSPYVYQYVPSLADYLAAYPRKKLEGVSEVIFWSEMAAPRMRRTLTVNHLAMYTPSEATGMTLVASKQIYANHYFEAAFDLTSVIDRKAADGRKGSYLLVLRRFRFDNLPKGGILNIRGKVVASLRDQMLADLQREKTTAE